MVNVRVRKIVRSMHCTHVYTHRVRLWNFIYQNVEMNIGLILFRSIESEPPRQLDMMPND